MESVNNTEKGKGLPEKIQNILAKIQGTSLNIQSMLDGGFSNEKIGQIEVNKKIRLFTFSLQIMSWLMFLGAGSQSLQVSKEINDFMNEVQSYGIGNNPEEVLRTLQSWIQQPEDASIAGSEIYEKALFLKNERLMSFMLTLVGFVGLVGSNLGHRYIGGQIKKISQK